MEVELDETKEKYRHLESSMSSGEKSLKKKVTSLEGNLEQLTVIYHQLVSKLTSAKVENQVNCFNFERNFGLKLGLFGFFSSYIFLI